MPSPPDTEFARRQHEQMLEQNPHNAVGHFNVAGLLKEQRERQQAGMLAVYRLY